MKNSILFFFFLFCTSFIPPSSRQPVSRSSASNNLFIIIADGLRWQEIFNGADSFLINNEKFTLDTATIKSLFWDESIACRRNKLMPFFWNVLAKKGQLYGNRQLSNKINVANPYAISYPGYNEIFTGTTDLFISSNRKKGNSNLNVLEYLNQKEEFAGKIAIFSSWDVFPYILNKKRNNLSMNSGYQSVENKDQSYAVDVINEIQQTVHDKKATRADLLTFSVAKEYIRTQTPRIVVAGFGETDDFAHQKRYDLYLQQINQFDRMVAELWYMVQTHPAYKNKTNFLITTDHGRGNATQWANHGFFVKGSSATWLGLIGPKIEPHGEVKEKQQFYNKQLAKTIANLVDEEF